MLFRNDKKTIILISNKYDGELFLGTRRVMALLFLLITSLNTINVSKTIRVKEFVDRHYKHGII